MPRMRFITTLALVLLAASAPAAPVDIEALRAFFEDGDRTRRPDESVDLVLAYRTFGGPATLTDVRVEVRVEPRSGEPKRQLFRLREAVVPQSEHRFHVALDLASLRLEAGEHRVTMKVDSDDRFAETIETNNVASTRLVVATAPAAASVRVLRPESVRVVAVRPGSPFEREWTSPLEVGQHPGYGLAAAVLRFEHPLRDEDRHPSRVTLRLRGSEVGDPFAELGRLQAHVRALPAPGASCGVSDATPVLVRWDGESASVDLTSLVAQDERTTSRQSCDDRLEVVLAFEERPATRPARGNLLRLDETASALEVELR
jgi:hypothetical protein